MKEKINKNIEYLKEYNQQFEKLHISIKNGKKEKINNTNKLNEIINEINLNFKKLNQDLEIKRKRLNELFKKSKQKTLEVYFL